MLINFHCQISRDKFEPKPGFEPGTSRSLAWRSTNGDTEVRGLNPGSDFTFSLEI